MRKFLIYWVFIWGVSSCLQNDRLEYALQFAGDNRIELEKVLKHYEDSGLKYNAACFIIENMPHYFSYEGWQLDSVKKAMATIDSIGLIQPDLIKKWGNVDYRKLHKVYDAHVITAEYLQKNIDTAFEAWHSRSWNKELSFEDFCELLLPYRIDNEPLGEWRNAYYQKYAYILDSIHTRDIIEAADIVGLRMKEHFRYSWDFSIPHQGGATLLEHPMGNCRDACDFFVYTMRALGIPATVDYYAYSPESRKSHTWNVVRDTTGKYVPCLFADGRIKRDTFETDHRKMGKVFRGMYAQQPETYSGVYKDTHIPVFFKDRHRKDVSCNYFENVLDVDFDNSLSGQYGYLGTFHPDRWVGIAMSKIEKGKAAFCCMEPECVYVPLVYEGNRYRSVNYPFLFDGKEKKEFVPDMDKCGKVELLRKAVLYKWSKVRMGDMVGSGFYFSDTKDFQSYTYHYVVTDTLKSNYNMILPPAPITCRYMCMKPAMGRFVELAELQFYSDRDSLIIPVKIDAAPESYVMRVLDNAFDGDPLTYYKTDSIDIPVVIDFGKQVQINRFLFMPRNDDNFIRIGDVYELFYHGGSKGWISLGQKMATDMYLEYDNVPANALLHLRNRTRGEEEHIFYMKEGKQKFISDLGEAV